MGMPFGNWPGPVQQVTVQKMAVTGTDETGNDVWGIASAFVVDAVLIPLPLKRPPRASRPGGFQESLEGEYIVAEGATLLLPAGTNLTVTDQVVAAGQTWLIDGYPVTFTSPFTGVALMQAELNLVTG